MSFQIGSVVLPHVPYKIMDTWKVGKLTKKAYPNNLPIIVSIGQDRGLEVEGWIFVQGQTAAYLETNYIIPLRQLVHTEVTISAPDTRYDGSYVFESFVVDEEYKYLNAFKFKAKFSPGALVVVI